MRYGKNNVNKTKDKWEGKKEGPGETQRSAEKKLR